MFLCVSALVIGVSSVEAGITTIRIDKTEPLADGAAFGTAGAYERVTGIARGEVDPRDPRNAGIVNLDKAPRNARVGSVTAFPLAIANLKTCPT
jgi:hypothetical protein